MTPNEESHRLDASHGVLRTLLLALAALSLSGEQVNAQAQISAQTTTFSLPEPKVGKTSPTSGLSVQIQIDGTAVVDQFGYRNVQFRFESPAAVTGEKLLTVKFYAGRNKYPAASISIERDGSLPSGTTVATLQLPTPSFSRWERVWWEVWVDGVPDPNLSLNADQPFYLPNFSSGDSLKLLSLNDQPIQWSRDPLTNLREQAFAIEVARDLPQRWFGYTPHDIVSADLPRLTELIQASPKRFDALRRWVAAGGVLWIPGVEEDDYAAIDKLFATSSQITFASDEDDEGPTDGWTHVWLRDPEATSEKPEPKQPSAEATVDELLAAKNKKKKDRPPGEPSWFAERAYGFGVVTAFPPPGESDIEFLSVKAWRDLLDSGGQELSKQDQAAVEHWRERQWTRRHGLAPDSANNDFSNLLVPGVGLAPVNEFQVLITLFAIVIGPLNYWLLKRWQRTHLMVLTVPIAAVGLTVSLLLYAVLGDGFGVKVRARAVTLIDQTNGEHATWGRLSYYAGLAPGDGFDLPDNCVMYPILPGWNDLSLAQTTATTREVAWTDGRQQLRGGWLRSRAPTQYLQVRSGPTDLRLVVETAGSTPTAKNELGADVEWLLLIDEQGAMFQADAVRADATAELASVERLDAGNRLRSLVLKNDPLPPDGIKGDDAFALSERERRAAERRLRSLQVDYADARLDENLLNAMIDNAAGLSGGETLPLPPRSYLAVTQTAVGVDLGIEGARQLGGFHLVIGRW